MVDRRALSQVKVGPCATAQVTLSGASPASEAVSVGGKARAWSCCWSSINPLPLQSKVMVFSCHTYL